MSNEELWKRMSSLYYAKRVGEALSHWADNARWEAAYPVEGLPAVVEGREALTQMFAALVSAAENVEVHDVRFHQTADPDVAFVEERMVIDLVGGGGYENRIAMRVTFRDGQIAEMLEYADPRETQALLDSLAVVA